MSAKARALNAIGGIPDRMLLGIPDVTVGKTSVERETYLRRLAFYDPDSWDPERKPFFRLPDGPPASEVVESTPFLTGRRDLFRYPSRYSPRNPELRDRFNSRLEDLSGYLHLWRHDGSADRPLVLVIHGLMMGGPAKARRMFRIDTLFQLGLDVALHTLPGHWRRSNHPWFQRLLSPADVPLTVERLAQNIHDLHSALILLRHTGYGNIGIIGASMGGFSAALYAAQVSGGPDFMFMAVPAVAVTNYLRPRQRRFGFPVDDALARSTGRAQELCSPLYLEPRFDVGRIRVVAHAGDRVCDVRDTRRWIKRWGIEDYAEVTGGHFLYLDKRARGEAWYGLLREHGYIGRGKPQAKALSLA
ncbi:MAG: alpha/beta hydrolase [Actinomycetota bacterium]